jgi:hypothetical protein
MSDQSEAARSEVVSGEFSVQPKSKRKRVRKTAAQRRQEFDSELEGRVGVVRENLLRSYDEQLVNVFNSFIVKLCRQPIPVCKPDWNEVIRNHNRFAEDTRIESLVVVCGILGVPKYVQTRVGKQTSFETACELLRLYHDSVQDSTSTKTLVESDRQIVDREGDGPRYFKNDGSWAGYMIGGTFFNLTESEKALVPTRKIEAIVELRKRTSLGLREAKDVVDSFAAYHDRTTSAR